MLVLAAIFAGFGADAAHAEVDFGADVGVATHYMWRGITIVNRPVLQPDVWVSRSFSEASATLSLWGSIELGRYDSPSALSEAEGAHAFDLTELDPTLEVTLPLGRVELTAGAAGYLYPNETGYTFDDNAAEIYGRVTVGSWWGLSHSFSVYQDVTAIDGTYLELGLSRTFALRKNLGVEVSAAAGWSLGQAVEYDAAWDVKEPGNFASDGFTHAEISIALPFEYGRFSAKPTANVVFGHDDATKLYSGTGERDVKGWFGVIASFHRSRGD